MLAALATAAGANAGQDAPPPAQVLSIDAAVRDALRRNPTLDDAAAAVRRAQSGVGEARALRLPRLDGTSELVLKGPIPTFTFTGPAPQPGQPPQRQEVSFGKTFTKNLTVTGSYDVDPFGRLRDGQRIAERSVNAARGALFVARNELVYAVQSIYLGALRARELIGVAQESLDAAGEQLRVAEVQFRAGSAPEFDVLRARVQVANVRQTLVAAEAGYRRALASLAELVAADQRTRFELVPLTLPPEPDQVAAEVARPALEPAAGDAVPVTLEAALAEAFDRRPEVYRAEWNRRVAEGRLRLEEKGKRPRLNVAANYFFDPDSTGFAAQTSSWSMVANIAFPIWDAGLTRVRTQRAKDEVASADAQMRAVRDTVAGEVKRALLDLEESAERRRAAAANTSQAREALRIARVRYTAGLAPNVEVTDAEAALTQARSNEVNAAYDYMSALANLNRGLGRYAGAALAAGG